MRGMGDHLVGRDVLQSPWRGQLRSASHHYRDCGLTNTNGTASTSPRLACIRARPLQGTMELNFNAVTNIDPSGNPCGRPSGRCIERAEYISTVTLRPRVSHTIVYQRCCRNPQVINLLDYNTGFDVCGSPPVLQTRAGHGVELLPEFDEPPAGLRLSCQLFELPNLATDPDGDSLFYSIGDVFIGGSFSAPTPNPPNPPPFTNVTWKQDTGQILLGGETRMPSRSTSNGTLVASPTAGKYVIGIYVTEFRQDDRELEPSAHHPGLHHRRVPEIDT